MSQDKQMLTLKEFTDFRNSQKFLFTAGPASLLVENLEGLRPCFGRGDEDYEKVEESVMNNLKKMTGHKHLARMQGSASLALEISSLNFLTGKVLIVNTGYYSDRLKTLSESSMKRLGQIKEVQSTKWTDLDQTTGKFDWILACSTETSVGLRLPIESLSKNAKRLSSKLFLDATASIGLETGHELADVVAYSSCKGLFGLTGAAFIAFNEAATVPVDSFYLDINSHLEKKMTGPYHALASLKAVLDRHDYFREAVVINKRAFTARMAQHLAFEEKHQPLLCTFVRKDISSNDKRAVLYKPRGTLSGSVVCHLGEAHLGRKAQAQILDALIEK